MTKAKLLAALSLLPASAAMAQTTFETLMTGGLEDANTAGIGILTAAAAYFIALIIWSVIRKCV